MSVHGAGSFAEIYDEHVWDVYGFFGYRVQTREEAEDLTQMTFERALRAWHRYDPKRAAVRTWLIAIGQNVLIDHYRRGRSRPEDSHADLESLESGAAVQAEVGASLGLDPDLEQALGNLSQRELELIALRFGADLTGPEIAEMTGLSLANVQQILSRTLRSLRAKLEQHSESRRR